ncbi:MAG TPA: hypothetical protein VG819_01220 [Rhizomicrobium sp.]|jgi:hypothetical protein|nr:hypothetical protein [Rhizomicrobium sp.]
MDRHPHILNAATNLLGICFVIVGGLKLAGQNANSYADEIAWASALLLLASIVTSYLAIRNRDSIAWQNRYADWSFLGGVALLVVSMAAMAIQL